VWSRRRPRKTIRLDDEVRDDGLELIAIGSDRPEGGDGVLVDPAWID
jgi:hypothetical protein